MSLLTIPVYGGPGDSAYAQTGSIAIAVVLFHIME